MGDTCIVQITGLCKTYGDGAAVPALIDVSLSIPSGKFLAICGPSGSGKSTLLNLIGTLDHPTSGRLIVDGVDINSLKGDSLADFRRAKIGFVFQLFNLVPALTALENVMLPLLPYQRGLSFKLEKRAQELLESLGLRERLHHLPGQLSGGEQQRVAIARALINYPKLILADEPTGNLDSKTADSVFRLFESLVDSGKTILMVTHDDELAGRAKRTIVLADGAIVNERMNR